MNHCDRVGCWEGTLQTGFQCCFAALPFVVGALLARSFRHRSTSSEYRQRPTLSSVPGPGQLLAVANGGGQANNMGGAMPPLLTSDKPGVEAASTALKPNKCPSLMELLDALEFKDEDEIDGEQPAPDEGGMMPRNDGGMTNGSGPMMNREALKPLPMRDAPPTPVRDSMSFATGDAAIAERRRAFDRRLEQHLRDNGLRSEAHRGHAVALGRQERARMALDAASDGFEDFSMFCPGIARIDVL